MVTWTRRRAAHPFYGPGRDSPLLKTSRTPQLHTSRGSRYKVVMRICLLVGLVYVIACGPCRADTITVGVAISLKDAAGEIAVAYKADAGQDVEFTFGSSGQLMAQIRN